MYFSRNCIVILIILLNIGCYSNTRRPTTQDYISGIAVSLILVVADIYDNEGCYCFPYSEKGGDNVLYFLSGTSYVPLLYDSAFVDSKIGPPWDFDHENELMINGNLRYINRPNIHYTANSTEAIIVLVTKLLENKDRFLFVGSDACMYEGKTKREHFNENKLLGLLIADIPSEIKIRKIRDDSHLLNVDYDWKMNYRLRMPTFKKE